MPIVVVVDNGQAPTTMGVVEEDCYNRNRIYTVYGRIDDRTVPLASEKFSIRYGILSSRNRQHAVAIRPYTVYGTVYSPTLMMWQLVATSDYHGSSNPGRVTGRVK